MLRVAGVLPGLSLDRRVRGGSRIRPIRCARAKAFVELGRAGEGAVVDLELEVALVLEPMTDVDDEGYERDRGRHERGDDDDHGASLASQSGETALHAHAALGHDAPPMLSAGV